MVEAGLGVPLDEVWPEPDARFLRGEETGLSVWIFSSCGFEADEVVVTTGESAMMAVWRRRTQIAGCVTSVVMSGSRWDNMEVN